MNRALSESGYRNRYRKIAIANRIEELQPIAIPDTDSDSDVYLLFTAIICHNPRKGERARSRTPRE